LYDTGFASKAEAVSRDDGLRLRGARILSICRCAPPQDKPTPTEIRNCSRHLTAEIEALSRVRVVVALGRVAFDGYLNYLVQTGIVESRKPYAFAHGAEHRLPNGITLVVSYHPSLRNTNTGRLDRAMLTRVFARARELAGLD
jgi:uracil-DNA glycosylase family 4